jgi:hypothetical protein
MSEQGLSAWKLPLIVGAIALSIVAGFYLGGPGLGMAVGGLDAAVIVVMAVRNPPRTPILPPPARDGRRHVLLVVNRPLEDAEAVESVAHLVQGGVDREPQPEVLLIAPCRNRFLDRWASDFGPGRHRAQRNLVLSVASLAKAEVDAEGRVGDENLVQTVEDALRSFPATEVILVAGSSEHDSLGESAARELQERLRVPFRRVVADSPDAATAPSPTSRTRVT